MKPASFVLHLGITGFDAVHVNGTDVTKHVDAVSVLSREGQPPIVRLGLKPGIDVSEIAGDGIVEIEPAAGDVLHWLSSIDAGEVERAVLERSAFSTMSTGGSPIATALEVLHEMAAGR